MIGKIYPRLTLIPGVFVGDAKNKNGGEYTLSTTLGVSHPCITSRTTGKSFILSWEEILQMAYDAGIDEPEGGK